MVHIIREGGSEICIASHKVQLKILRTRNQSNPQNTINTTRASKRPQCPNLVVSFELAPEKAKSVPSVGKVMASVLWDAKGIILIDYLEKGKAIPFEQIEDSYCGEMSWNGQEKDVVWKSICSRNSKLSGSTKICVQGRNHPGSQRSFRGPWRKSLWGRNWEPGETLGQVRWTSTELCRKITRRKIFEVILLNSVD